MEVQIKLKNVNVPDEYLNSQVVVTYISQKGVIFEAQTIIQALIVQNDINDENMLLHIPFQTHSDIHFNIKVIDQYIRVELNSEKQFEAIIDGLSLSVQLRSLATYKSLQLFSKVEGVTLQGQLTPELTKALNQDQLQITTCYALNSNWNYLVTCKVNELIDMALPPVPVQFLNTFLSIRYKHSFIFVKSIVENQQKYSINLHKFVLEAILDGVEDEGDPDQPYTIVNFERTEKSILQHAKDAPNDQVILSIELIQQQQRESLIQVERNDAVNDMFQSICLREDNQHNKNAQFAYLMLDNKYLESEDKNDEHERDPVTEEIYPQLSSLIVRLQLVPQGNTYPFTIPKHVLWNESDVLNAKLYLDTIILPKTTDSNINKYEQLEKALDNGVKQTNQELTSQNECSIQEIQIQAYQLIEKPLFKIRLENNQVVQIYTFERYKDVLRLLAAKKELEALELDKKFLLFVLKMQKFIMIKIIFYLTQLKQQLLQQKAEKPLVPDKSNLSCAILKPKPILKSKSPLPLKSIQRQPQIQQYIPFSLQVQQKSRIYPRKIEEMISDVLWFFRQRMSLMTKRQYKHQLTLEVMHYLLDH